MQWTFKRLIDHCVVIILQFNTLLLLILEVYIFKYDIHNKLLFCIEKFYCQKSTKAEHKHRDMYTTNNKHINYFMQNKLNTK